jgi:hypothetical protein
MFEIGNLGHSVKNVLKPKVAQNVTIFSYFIFSSGPNGHPEKTNWQKITQYGHTDGTVGYYPSL